MQTAVSLFLFAIFWKLFCFDNISLRLQINSQIIWINALHNATPNSFVSFIEGLELWLKSFDAEKPFSIVGDTNTDVLQNNSKTAS